MGSIELAKAVWNLPLNLTWQSERLPTVVASLRTVLWGCPEVPSLSSRCPSLGQLLRSNLACNMHPSHSSWLCVIINNLLQTVDVASVPSWYYACAESAQAGSSRLWLHCHITFCCQLGCFQLSQPPCGKRYRDCTRRQISQAPATQSKLSSNTFASNLMQTHMVVCSLHAYGTIQSENSSSVFSHKQPTAIMSAACIQTPARTPCRHRRHA